MEKKYPNKTKLVEGCLTQPLMVGNRVVFLLFEVRQLQVLKMMDLYCKFKDPIQKAFQST